MSEDLPTLVVNPLDDAAFGLAALVAARDGAQTPAALQASLRIDYPDAVVRARELMGEQGRVWYVYRDGHWVLPPRPI